MLLLLEQNLPTHKQDDSFVDNCEQCDNFFEAVKLGCSDCARYRLYDSVKKRRLIFFWLMAYGGLRLIVFWLTAKSLNSAKSRKRDRSGEIRLIYWKSVFLAIFQWISSGFDPFFRKKQNFFNNFSKNLDWTNTEKLVLFISTAVWRIPLSFKSFKDW